MTIYLVHGLNGLKEYLGKSLIIDFSFNYLLYSAYLVICREIVLDLKFLIKESPGLLLGTLRVSILHLKQYYICTKNYCIDAKHTK